MTITNAYYITPKLEGHEDFRLDSFLIHKQPTLCAFCGSHSTTSSVFEVWCRPGPYKSQLVPARSLRPGTHYPIGISELKPKIIPVCHLCYTIAAPATTTPPTTEDEWRAALKNKYSPIAAPAPTVGIAKTITKLPITHSLSTAHVGRSALKIKQKLPAPTLDQL